MLASGDSYEAGSTGGEAEHDHETKVQFCYYRGTVNGYPQGAVNIYDYRAQKYQDNILTSGMYYVLGNDSLGNLYGEKVSQIWESTGFVSKSSTIPPYLSVYCWECIA